MMKKCQLNASYLIQNQIYNFPVVETLFTISPTHLSSMKNYDLNASRVPNINDFSSELYIIILAKIVIPKIVFILVQFVNKSSNSDRILP